jgi:citrate lyase subunit beta / citryl-CoA lyase
MAVQLETIRSFLFIPGNRASWIERSITSSADAIILDLEDSVPPDQKIEARSIVNSKLAWLFEKKQRTWVRINRSPHLYDFDDIVATVGPYLQGIMISKPNGPEDIDTVSAMLAEAEYRKGMAIGMTQVIPILETARSLQFAYEIALRDRVPAIIGATARNGDVERALSTIWSLDGREALYLKSRVVMAARAANKLPIGGLWQQIHDLDGLRTACERDRALGMRAQLVLHPSNIAMVNRIYSPQQEEVAYYLGMIAALDAAQREGRASCMYEGEHIDIAHVKTAREIVALSQNLGVELPR